MLEDPIDILKKLVEDEGDCSEWRQPMVCKRCPLNFKTIDGVRVRCLDYVLYKYTGKRMPLILDSEMDGHYLSAAEDELFQIELESLLSE